MRYAIVGAVCVGLLTACGDSKPPQKTVFDPQVQALKKAREVGGDIRLCGLPTQVKAVLEVAHLDKLFQIFPGADEAATAFPKPA